MPKEIRSFTYHESTMNPLVKVEDKIIKQMIIDPTTGKPYDGLILEGIAADLAGDVANNNNRLYDEENYLQFVAYLKQQIFSKKGVYGEFEHPEKGYNIKGYKVSHKLLDIWYVPETKKVWIRVMVLNTPNGQIVQEIIKSGGQIAISARAAGEEVKGKDGIMRARLKLLVTFDLVYHPGFSMANLDLVELNESLRFGKSQNSVPGFSLIVYDEDQSKMSKLYESYILKDGAADECFLAWLSTGYADKLKDLKESQQQSKQKKQQQKMQKGQSSSQDKVQNQLEKAADEDLSETFTDEELEAEAQLLDRQQAFFQNVKQQQKKLGSKAKGKFSKQGNSFYDNSAGFIVNEDDEEDF